MAPVSVRTGPNRLVLTAYWRGSAPNRAVLSWPYRADRPWPLGPGLSGPGPRAVGEGSRLTSSCSRVAAPSPRSRSRVAPPDPDDPLSLPRVSAVAELAVEQAPVERVRKSMAKWMPATHARTDRSRASRATRQHDAANSARSVRWIAPHLCWSGRSPFRLGSSPAGNELLSSFMGGMP